MINKLDVKQISTIKYFSLFFLLNIVDCLLTLQAINNGCSEVMPIMKALLEQGTIVFCSVKLSLCALISYGFYRIGERKYFSSNKVAKLLVVIMAIVCVNNIVVIILN